MVTLDSLSKLFPKALDINAIYIAFQKYFSIYGINTKNRQAGFISQCAHESGNFTTISENLNYSAQGLLATFPKYFKTLSDTTDYVRQPQKIANKVYANRMGNSTEESGDGWKYKGTGFIQITGKNNYTAFANYKKITVTEVIIYINTIEGSVESALFFWKNNNINTYCDNDDIVGMTKKINGGIVGLQDRTVLYNTLKSLIS